MKWQHKCSIDWLKARQSFLTATDIKDLLPVTKTGRKRTITDEDYLKVLSRKLIRLTDEDCMSYGAAARGHIMEPYAIEMFNSLLIELNAPQLYHWDDKIVAPFGSSGTMFPLGFSPDAVDIPMDSGLLFHPANAVVVSLPGTGKRVIGEVKSYSPEKHMICGNTAAKDLEERWQIATAMAVCNKIEEAYLMFFNPSMKEQMYVKLYLRCDLEKEIEMIEEAYDGWRKWVDDYFAAGPFGHAQWCFAGDDKAEDRIIERIVKKEEMSPIKTVIL